MKMGYSGEFKNSDVIAQNIATISCRLLSCVIILKRGSNILELKRKSHCPEGYLHLNDIYYYRRG